MFSCFQNTLIVLIFAKEIVDIKSIPIQDTSRVEWQMISNARSEKLNPIVQEKRFIQESPKAQELVQGITEAVRNEDSFKMISRHIYEHLMVKYRGRFWAVFTSTVDFMEQKQSSMYFRGDYLIAQVDKFYVAIFETGA